MFLLHCRARLPLSSAPLASPVFLHWKVGRRSEQINRHPIILSLQTLKDSTREVLLHKHTPPMIKEHSSKGNSRSRWIILITCFYLCVLLGVCVHPSVDLWRFHPEDGAWLCKCRTRMPVHVVNKVVNVIIIIQTLFYNYFEQDLFMWGRQLRHGCKLTPGRPFKM